jgi:CheY-like chemotaxis protein
MNKVNAVLLVDDDEATNFINQLLIRKLDMTDELLIARNGKDAIEMIQQYCANHLAQAAKGVMPKLIFLDINMPVMDGFGFLEAFDNLDCPGKEAVVIVVLTTSLNPKDLQRIQESKVVKDFVNKPLTISMVNQLMDKHLV